jgi:hypothetical protein
LQELRAEGLLTGDIWQGISEEYRLTEQALASDVQDFYARYPDLERDVVLQARREALKAERAALRDALVRGWLSSQAHHTLVAEIDLRLEALRLIGETRSSASPPAENASVSEVQQAGA